MPNNDDLKLFSKSELISLIEFMDQVVRIKEADALATAIKNLKNLIPHQYALANVSHIHKAGVIPMDVANVSYPSEFLRFYFENGLEAVDPLVQCHYRTFELQVWSETFKKVGKVSRKLEYAAQDFNMKDGLTYGLPEPGLSIGSFFCLAGDHLKPRERHIRLFEKVVPHLHEAYLRVLPRNAKHAPCMEMPPELTPRELEILDLVKDGLTNCDISDKLHISLNTVKYHLHHILIKLDARGRAHAVAKAMGMGIIYF